MSHILTIDDGPTTRAAEKIDYLNAHNIPSIWFCLGENLEKNPDAALRAIQTGHIIANHSFSHPHFSEIDLENAASEIESTEDLIDDLYATVGVTRPARLFRFPFGDQGQNKYGDISEDPERVQKKADLQTYLDTLAVTAPVIDAYEYREPFIGQSGDLDWLWSYDIQDWAIHYDDPKYHLSQDQVMANLRKYLESFDRQKDQIILTHDHEDTTALFSELVDTFVGAGINFRLPEL